MIISNIKENLKEALKAMGISVDLNFNVEKSRTLKQGDFSSNIALTLAKQEKQNPMVLAATIIKNLNQKDYAKVEISKPGFINFFLNTKVNNQLINKILKEGDKYGQFPKKKTKYNVEYVSANPTGYLHIGHARNAVLGDTIAALLRTYGYPVITEYVVNDAGNQMNKIAMSTLLRYKELFGEKIEMPEDSYHGTEVISIAEDLKKQFGDKYLKLELDEKMNITDEKANYDIRWFARDKMLDIIKDHLHQLGTDIEIYFSETDIHKSGAIKEVIKRLGDNAYVKDGATWLRSTKFGDDKDRVIIKSDGVPTYFAPDIAYHEIKLRRNKGVDKLINVWGADHFSYITRMTNAMLALGYPEGVLTVVCMQMVKLVKDGEEFKLSKRSGNSLRLIDLVDTIGKDAARWFLISQSPNTHIELDVNVATKKDNNNPIYYVQYAHARANQILAKGKYDTTNKFDLLTSDSERELIDLLHYYKHTIEVATNNIEPNKLPLYLTSLAKQFHSYYSSNKIIDPDNKALSQQRYYLVKACKQVIANGLHILGIKPMDKM